MWATIGSSSMIRTFFIRAKYLSRCGAGRAVGQKLFNHVKFSAHLRDDFGDVLELVVIGERFHLAQKRHDPAHAASSACAGATVRDARDTDGIAGLECAHKVLDLFSGLAQID